VSHTLTPENLAWLEAESRRRTQPKASVSKSDLINEALDALRIGYAPTVAVEAVELAAYRALLDALAAAKVPESPPGRFWLPAVLVNAAADEMGEAPSEILPRLLALGLVAAKHLREARPAT